MADSNVSLVGNVTRTPELRYTASGRGVASFGLAVNRRYQTNGEWQEEVSFFDVTCWGSLGENIASSVDKGTRVVVIGRLSQRSWESPEGEKRSKIEVVADEIGPSLRWAEAQITRNDRSQAERPAEPAPAGTSGGRPSTYDPSEEPFLTPATMRGC